MSKEKILKAVQQYVLKGQIGKAIKEYERIVKDAPKDIRARLKLGDLYLKNGETQKAIEEYLKVAELYEEEDLNSRAISSYKRVLALNPRLIEAYYKVAELYLKEGLRGDARNCYQSILKMRPNDEKALEALRNLSEDQPQKEIRSTGSPTTRTPPPSDTATSQQSPRPEERVPLTPPLTYSHEAPIVETPIQSGEPSAEKGVSPSLDKDSEMHYHLGIAYKEMELFDYAISEFEQAARNPSIQFDSYVMLGNCFMEKGDYDRSIEHYRMAAEIKDLPNQKLAMLQLCLGSAYEASGMISEALGAYQNALELDPSSSEAREKIRNLQQK